jgi:hypothetical protein
MDPRARNALVAVGLGVGVGVAGLWWFARQRAEQAATPPWGVYPQPPENLDVVATPEASWAANRATPMMACCDGQGAGRRTLRRYPATRDADPNSLVGLNFTFNGDC